MDDALPGDLMRKEGTGGLFVTEDAVADRARVRAFEITPTGPMFGARMRWPEADARAREEACRARWGLDDEHLERFRSAGEGTRRPYRMAVTEASVEADEDGLVVRFVLPSGGYATMVLRELLGRTVG
jgi:tRNA pseudouridine13 synthase